MPDKPTQKAPDAGPECSAPEPQAGVSLRTLFPVSRFEHGIKGAPPVTSLGVYIANQSLAAQIRDKAAECGVSLEES